jgi:hypothetical protein
VPVLYYVKDISISGAFSMKRPLLILGLALFVLTISSCAPSGPSISEIIDTFEITVKERDVEGMTALFAKDATINESFISDEETGQYIFIGEQEINDWGLSFFQFPVNSEFRDISVDGDTATFGWVVIDSVYTKL